MTKIVLWLGLAAAAWNCLTTQTSCVLRATLPHTKDADDTLELVKSNVLRGASLEFNAIDDEWNGTQRDIRSAQLNAIGLVTRPAYPGSVIEARYADIDEQDDLAIQEEEQRLLGTVVGLLGKNAAKKLGQRGHCSPSAQSGRQESIDGSPG